MATTFSNGTLTITKTTTATLAQRLITGVLGANGIPVVKPDGTALTNQEKMDAFDAWLWRYLKNDAKSYESRSAGSTAATTAETELP